MGACLPLIRTWTPPRVKGMLAFCCVTGERLLPYSARKPPRETPTVNGAELAALAAPAGLKKTSSPVKSEARRATLLPRRAPPRPGTDSRRRLAERGRAEEKNHRPRRTTPDALRGRAGLEAQLRRVS